MQSLIVAQTELYAHQNNRLFKLPKYILKRFIGLLFFTGDTIVFHEKKCIGRNAEDTGIELVRNTMSRQQFRNIKRNIHLSDNSQVDPQDKLCKLRPLFQLLNAKFQQFGVFETHLS